MVPSSRHATQLNGPNGLAVDERGVWVVSDAGDLYRLDEKGKKQDEQKLPKAKLDGFVILPDGTFLISSWEASAVFRGKPGGKFEPIITDVKAPADIGFDTKRNRVLIPLFSDSVLQFHDIELATAAEPAEAKPDAAKATDPAKPAQPATPAKPAKPGPAKPPSAKK